VHLTIVGGVRERVVVTRRGRGNKACARGAWWALSGGPSTSPLADAGAAVNIDVIFGRYAWLIFLLSTVGFLWPSPRLRERLTNDAAFAEVDRSIRRKAFLWMSVPWVVMGFGQLIGGVPSVWHFFDPRHGGPWVLAFFFSIFALWIASAYWIFAGDGAGVIVDHQLVAAHGIRGPIELTPNRVRLFFALALLGGLVAVGLMFTGAFHVPASVR
jgi:hypothetical protein